VEPAPLARHTSSILALRQPGVPHTVSFSRFTNLIMQAIQNLQQFAIYQIIIKVTADKLTQPDKYGNGIDQSASLIIFI
jgi:hypothetical protein